MSGVKKSIRDHHINKTDVKSEYEEEEYRKYEEYYVFEEIDMFHYNRLPIFE
jgi:hypothetical protein